MAWRWLHVIGLFIMCNMLGLYVSSVLLLPAIQFVSGLDAVRYRQLEWLAKRGVSTTLLSYNCISVVGTSVALFGAAASTQDVGAVLGFGGCAVGTGSGELRAAYRPCSLWTTEHSVVRTSTRCNW